MIPLQEWIFSHKNIILCHSPFINSADVISTIISNSEWEGKSVFFMLEDGENLNEALGKELPSQLYIPYQYNNTLHVIFQHEVYLFVDNIKLFREISTIKLEDENNKTENNKNEDNKNEDNKDENSKVRTIYNVFKTRSIKTHIIFLTSLNILSEDIAFLRSIIPDITDVYLSLHSSEIELDFIKVMTVNMTSTQLINYKHIPKNNTTSMLKICNFDYPKEYLELEDNNSWISTEVLFNLNAYSPKIHLLLHDVVGNRYSKHYIHTRFEKKYGTMLISELLTLLNIKHTILLRSDSIDTRIDKINQFNNNNGGNVILSSVYPSTNIKYIDRIHFLEGFTILTYFSITSKILKRNNYGSNPYVRLQFYVTQMPEVQINEQEQDIDQISIDQISIDQSNIDQSNIDQSNIDQSNIDQISIDSDMYLQFADDLTKCNIAYNELHNNNLIIYHENKGLTVINNKNSEEVEEVEDVEKVEEVEEVKENIKE